MEACLNGLFMGHSCINGVYDGICVFQFQTRKVFKVTSWKMSRSDLASITRTPFDSATIEANAWDWFCSFPSIENTCTSTPPPQWTLLPFSAQDIQRFLTTMTSPELGRSRLLPTAVWPMQQRNPLQQGFSLGGLCRCECRILSILLLGACQSNSRKGHALSSHLPAGSRCAPKQRFWIVSITVSLPQKTH